MDDELSLLQLLEQVVEEQGHQVFTAINGKEALRIIERERPRLVISDVMMPIMDGYKLLEQIRSHSEFKAIKVILISAAPIRPAKHIHADKYLTKPYNIEDLEHIISTFV